MAVKVDNEIKAKAGANTDIFSILNAALKIGRDEDNKIYFNVDDTIKIYIAGVLHSIVSISDGTEDNDKLVTQGYVDDGLATKVDEVSSTDNAIVKFDGTGGSVQNTGVTVDDSNNMSFPDATYIKIDQVRAFDAAGLQLHNDGGDGILIENVYGAIECQKNNEDAYPHYQLLPYTHDNIGLFLDCWYDDDPGFKSSDAGSNFGVYKQGDFLQFVYSSGHAQGSTFSPSVGVKLGNDGKFYIENLTGTTGGSDVRYNTTSKELFYDTSALKFKENIRYFKDNPDYNTNFIYKLARLTTIYDRKDGSRIDELGYIAEDVEKICPSYCNYTNDRIITRETIENQDGYFDGIIQRLISISCLVEIDDNNYKISRNEIKGDLTKVVVDEETKEKTIVKLLTDEQKAGYEALFASVPDNFQVESYTKSDLVVPIINELNRLRLILEDQGILINVLDEDSTIEEVREFKKKELKAFYNTKKNFKIEFQYTDGDSIVWSTDSLDSQNLTDFLAAKLATTPSLNLTLSDENSNLKEFEIAYKDNIDRQDDLINTIIKNIQDTKQMMNRLAFFHKTKINKLKTISAINDYNFETNMTVNAAEYSFVDKITIELMNSDINSSELITL